MGSKRPDRPTRGHMGLLPTRSHFYPNYGLARASALRLPDVRDCAFLDQHFPNPFPALSPKPPQPSGPGRTHLKQQFSPIGITHCRPKTAAAATMTTTPLCVCVLGRLFKCCSTLNTPCLLPCNGSNGSPSGGGVIAIAHYRSFDRIHLRTAPSCTLCGGPT